MHIEERLSRETAGEYALRVIRDNIISIDLAPGSIVSENELGKELGISRTPVREALKELSKVNLVEIYPQRGCMISLIDLNIVEESVFLRRVLEKAVVGELCDTITEEQVQGLERIIELQEFYLEKSEKTKVFELDNEFHKNLFILSNKTSTYYLMESMQGHFDRFRALSIYSVGEIKTVAEHRAIVEALRKHDKEEAVAVITKHLSRYKLEKDEVFVRYKEFFKAEVVR